MLTTRNNTIIRVGALALGALAIAACGGDDDEGIAADTTVAIAEADGGVAEEGSDVVGELAEAAAGPAPAAVRSCLEDAGFVVEPASYTDDELDFFELDTELSVEAGTDMLVTGSVNFYRSVERAERQQENFDTSVTDYSVGRNGAVVYAVIGDDPDLVAELDRCIIS